MIEQTHGVRRVSYDAMKGGRGREAEHDEGDTTRVQSVALVGQIDYPSTYTTLSKIFLPLDFFFFLLLEDEAVG